MKTYWPLLLALTVLAAIISACSIAYSTMMTPPKIVRAEALENDRYITVYFDRPAYRDNHPICYLSPVFQSLYHLCELDDNRMAIYDADENQVSFGNGLLYPDPHDLSRFSYISDTGYTRDRVLFFEAWDESSFSKFRAPITFYVPDDSPLTIESISVRSSNLQPQFAHFGDVITIRVVTSKPLWDLPFSAQVPEDYDHEFKIAKVGDREYIATYTVNPSTPRGRFMFNLYNFAAMDQTSADIPDPDGNHMVSETTDGSSITVL